MLLLKSDTEMYRGGGADDFLQCMISDISVDTQKATIFQKITVIFQMRSTSRECPFPVSTRMKKQLIL